MDGSGCSIDLLHIFPPIDRITPTEFEVLVRDWFEKVGHGMESFEVAHLETLPGTDGEYTFDVTVRFKAFHGAILDACKCKKHKPNQTRGHSTTE